MNLTTEIKELLIPRLEEWSRGENVPGYGGICSGVTDLVGDSELDVWPDEVVEELMQVAKAWPRYSGNEAFPVKGDGTVHKSEVKAFLYDHKSPAGMWALGDCEGQRYGTDRRDLARFLAEKLRNCSDEELRQLVEDKEEGNVPETD